MMTEMKQAIKIDPRTTVGAVTLGVRDIEKTTQFYNQAIGLDILDTETKQVRLGVDGTPLVILEHRPDGKAYPMAPGLYHLALLLPSRGALGQWLEQYSKKGYRLTGVADHLVSEALYLDDSEGNGIEIYRDRPREDWTYRNGELVMDTLALDMYALLEDGLDAEFTGMLEGTKMGHVHLKVNDLMQTEDFYRDVVGFDVTTGIPSARFLSAGGYHHHIGMNTWQSKGAKPRPKDALGLIAYQVILPDKAALDAHLEALSESGIQVDQTGEFPQLTDPSGNVLQFAVA